MINKDIKVTVNRDPFVILLEDIFEKKISNNILDEIIKNESNFEDAQIVSKEKQVVDHKYRSNKIAYFDRLYKSDRTKSILLTATENFISSQFLIGLLSCAQYPFSNYVFTDIHETQVSRYGGKKQKYDWHTDRINQDPSRVITISMYMFKEPKQFTDGEVILSNGLYSQYKLYGQTNEFRYTPKNNSCIIFSARTPHCVTPTESPVKFDAGRFSIQIWLGKKSITNEAILELLRVVRSGLS